MKISKIEIKKFRNLDSVTIELADNINILIGNNAQGKTNILESIYVLALTKSYRCNNDIDLIQYDEPFFKIKGKYIFNRNVKNNEIIVTKDKKILKLDGVEQKKVSSYLSTLNVIIFTPNDLEIVKHSPSDRRNFINTELCQLYNDYVIKMNEYNKILKMRNDYLKTSANKIDIVYFDILTQKLIEKAIIIGKYRRGFIEMLNEKIENIYFKITGEHGLSILYEESINNKVKDNSPDTIFKFFKNNFDYEQFYKMTLYGPHRDDFEFRLVNTNLKNFGSQGQQKVAVLSLKLAEIGVFKKVRGEFPIVLLDDIFSELDIKKKNKLLGFIKSNIQYVITTTDLKNINSKKISNAKIFKVEKGNAIERKN